jgi:hypothetical protein
MAAIVAASAILAGPQEAKGGIVQVAIGSFEDLQSINGIGLGAQVHLIGTDINNFSSTEGLPVRLGFEGNGYGYVGFADSFDIGGLFLSGSYLRESLTTWGLQPGQGITGAYAVVDVDVDDYIGTVSYDPLNKDANGKILSFGFTVDPDDVFYGDPKNFKVDGVLGNFSVWPVYGGGSDLGDVVLVPEPTTLALLGLGAAGLISARKRLRK